MLLGSGRQDPFKMTRIVWADVTSRVSHNKAQARVAGKETRKCDRSLARPSKVHLQSCRWTKKIKATQPSHLQQNAIQEDVVEGQRLSLPPLRSNPLNLPLSAPKNGATPEKCPVKTIRVDLRPILEKVIEPFSSWQECQGRYLQDIGGLCPTIRHPTLKILVGGKKRDLNVEDDVDGRHGDLMNGELHVEGKHEDLVDGELHVEGKHGDFMDRKHVEGKHGDLIDGELHVEGKHRDFMDGELHVEGKHGDLMDGELHVEGKHGDLMDGEHVEGKHGDPMAVGGEDLTDVRSHRTIKRPSICSKAEGTIKDFSLPSTMDSSETFGHYDPRNAKTLKDTLPQLKRSHLPAVVMLQPELSSPIFLPKILPEAERSTRGFADLSPDFQLPTRFLLQRLQETTTSQHHLLIAQILRELREDLWTDGPRASDSGEKQKSLLGLPRIEPWENGRKDNGPKSRNADFAARRRRTGRLGWKFNRSILAARIHT